jgi:hypothetical protein
MCATDSWGAHESFMHPIFVLKNGCDTWLELKLKVFGLECWSSENILDAWSREFT